MGSAATQVDASQPSGASQTEAGAPTQASQFQLLAARPLCDDSDRPMVKKVVRLESQRAKGAVLPVADPYRDLSCSDLGIFFPRGNVFASYISMVAVAKDDPDIREVDINGDKHLVTAHHHVVPFPEIDGAKPFAVEAFCHAPRLLVGKPIQDCDTDLMIYHVEWMARANDDVVRSVVAERDMVCHLLGMKPELASKKRMAEMLVASTPSKVTCSSWSDGS